MSYFDQDGNVHTEQCRAGFRCLHCLERDDEPLADWERELRDAYEQRGQRGRDAAKEQVIRAAYRQACSDGYADLAHLVALWYAAEFGRADLDDNPTLLHGGRNLKVVRWKSCNSTARSRKSTQSKFDPVAAQLRGFKRTNEIARRQHTAWLNDQADQ